jgi:hypothetical protein
MVIAERMAGSIVFLSYLLSVAGFVFDFFSPEGYTEWVFYLLPLLLISYTDSTKHLFSVTVINSILLLCGYFFSENIFDHIVIIHRVSGTVMIWALSINIYTRVRAQEWLRKNEKRLKESRQDLDRAQAVTKIGSWRIDSVKQ